MERLAEKSNRLNLLSGQILDAAIEVHQVLGGPGLLEAVYEEALAYELRLRDIGVERQIPVPIIYKEHRLKNPLFLDLFISKQIIVEVKSVEKFNPVFNAQLLTYLRLMNIPLGLIINFGEKYIKNGFHRVVNNFPGE
ncbi:GxxExxY protein [Desulfuromusa kysingii]|uniref:GxxExxY protein n=1 Tax=Desulfuromusa kysingii TaxID=37625 RepID=A0A1H4CN61_9BACT|nr:GxxExxY protein [Desulfuromusa kysingii]SEA61885.1 GxxExxY protein [Desulfuromusa kysingii]